MNKLYGLVLSGGKSTRMGTDKGLIDYHGIPQQEYIYKLLAKVCDKTYISINSAQKETVHKTIDVIVDKNVYEGPYNGILSAHHKYPNVAWLVVACDLPLLDMSALEQLVTERDSSKMATVFAAKESKLPEPLCAIWEVAGLKQSEEFLKNQKSKSPRKFLTENDVALVFPENEEVLCNVNSKEAYEAVKLKITSI